jgi:dihydroorotate dehydrogenase (fumarate)
MMDLTTTYLGFTLPHPLIPGASPLSADLGTIKRLEDAGAPAIILPSLFEEQITADELGSTQHMLAHDDSHAEAASYFPLADDYAMGPDRYLEHVRRVRDAVGVPVIGSLNGTTAHRRRSHRDRRYQGCNVGRPLCPDGVRTAQSRPHPSREGQA